MSKSLEDATALIPEMIAENVIGEVGGGPWETDATKYLVGRTHMLYKNNAKFRLRLKSTQGRDTLYAFMRHWLSGFLKRTDRVTFDRLPKSFHVGVAP